MAKPTYIARDGINAERSFMLGGGHYDLKKPSAFSGLLEEQAELRNREVVLLRTFFSETRQKLMAIFEAHKTILIGTDMISVPSTLLLSIMEKQFPEYDELFPRVRQLMVQLVKSLTDNQPKNQYVYLECSPEPEEMMDIWFGLSSSPYLYDSIIASVPHFWLNLREEDFTSGQYGRVGSDQPTRQGLEDDQVNKPRATIGMGWARDVDSMRRLATLSFLIECVALAIELSPDERQMLPEPPDLFSTAGELTNLIPQFSLEDMLGRAPFSVDQLTRLDEIQMRADATTRQALEIQMGARSLLPQVGALHIDFGQISFDTTRQAKYWFRVDAEQPLLVYVDEHIPDNLWRGNELICLARTERSLHEVGGGGPEHDYLLSVCAHFEQRLKEAVVAILNAEQAKFNKKRRRKSSPKPKID